MTVEDEVGNSDTEEVTVNVEEPPSTTSVDSDTSVDTDSDSETEIQTENQAHESDGSSDEDHKMRPKKVRLQIKREMNLLLVRRQELKLNKSLMRLRISNRLLQDSSLSLQHRLLL